MAPTVSKRGSRFKTKYLLLLIFQVVLILLYGIFVRYDVDKKTIDKDQGMASGGNNEDQNLDKSNADGSRRRIGEKTLVMEKNDGDTGEKVSSTLYAMFQDVHVMIFIGFGFLMTFLKKYGYSALGFTLLIGALVIQWAILCQSIFHLDTENKIIITLTSLVEADIMAAAILISFGAVLGRTTGPQLMVMAIIETAVCCSNLFLMNDVLQIADCGGSIAIHMFGAYFGLAVSHMMMKKNVNAVGDQQGNLDNDLEGPSYSSDITAMIGSIFLWIFWPSFNAALLTEDNEQYKAIVNTYLSLASATVTAFVVSAIVTQRHKFDMMHVQNSTLAGGVAVGSISNMHIHPFGALAVGMGAGIISVLGYKYLTPKLSSRWQLMDTCGVHNLHGMPGIYSGLMSVLFAYLATKDVYGKDLYSTFKAMKPKDDKDGRDALHQALYQLIGVVVTLLIAIFSGTITGFILKLRCLGRMPVALRYDDEKNWELPKPGAGKAAGTTENLAQQQSVELGATKY